MGVRHCSLINTTHISSFCLSYSSIFGSICLVSRWYCRSCACSKSEEGRRRVEERGKEEGRRRREGRVKVILLPYRQQLRMLFNLKLYLQSPCLGSSSSFSSQVCQSQLLMSRAASHVHNPPLPPPLAVCVRGQVRSMHLRTVYLFLLFAYSGWTTLLTFLASSSLASHSAFLFLASQFAGSLFLRSSSTTSAWFNLRASF